MWLLVLITRLFEICSTSLVALIRNFPLFCNFPLRFCNFPMSMSTNDVEQISNNRVINQESHVYFVKFGINLPRSFFKSPSLCSGRFQKFQKTNSVNLSQISLITMWLLVQIEMYSKNKIKGEGNFFKVFLIFSSDRKTLQIMNCAF